VRDLGAERQRLFCASARSRASWRDAPPRWPDESRSARSRYRESWDRWPRAVSRGLAGRGIAGRHVAFARDEDPALGADELDAVGIVARDRHRHAVGVAGVGLELAVDVPQSVGGNSAVPQISTGPVSSVFMPQWAVSTWCAPQPVIMPAPNCSQRSQPGRSKPFADARASRCNRPPAWCPARHRN
jgi:hypothetical protein